MAVNEPQLVQNVAPQLRNTDTSIVKKVDFVASSPPGFYCHKLFIVTFHKCSEMCWR